MPDNQQLFLLTKYTALIEQPNGFSMSELINAIEADYKDPQKKINTKEIELLRAIKQNLIAVRNWNFTHEKPLSPST